MFLENPPFPAYKGYIAVLTAWLLAQIIKVIVGVVREHRVDFRWLFDTGGMPSSHSSAVASLSTVVGMYYGWGSIPFGMSLVYSLVIMFDAAGVRRSVGKQAMVLNKMLDQLSHHGVVKESQVKELIGHTPVEVFAGAGMGIAIALILCR